MQINLEKIQEMCNNLLQGKLRVLRDIIRHGDDEGE